VIRKPKSSGGSTDKTIVVEVLRGEHVHLSADEVYRQARARLPEISLATVYNTLNELVSLRELQEVHVAGGPTRYDPNVLQPHHHLVCTDCGALYDVTPEGVAGLRLPASQRHGFRVADVSVVFRGRCARCGGQGGA
jgi:Fe2+ or Zn2+ uptake regulation protein